MNPSAISAACSLPNTERARATTAAPQSTSPLPRPAQVVNMWSGMCKAPEAPAGAPSANPIAGLELSTMSAPATSDAG